MKLGRESSGTLYLLPTDPVVRKMLCLVVFALPTISARDNTNVIA